MYSFLRGTLVSATPLQAILDVNGVGYKLHIPLTTSSQLPAPGKEIFLHTTLIVRENEHSLYGFLTTADRDLFDILCTVSGVGPKTALGLLGRLAPRALQEAIAQNNPALLAKAPGIGKKTAERLIIELRDKLPTLIDRPSDLAPTVRDAMGALLNLGYSQAKAQTAVQKVLKECNDLDLSTLITRALKHV
jgi:holliday junction DNA helicase RuvA